MNFPGGGSPVTSPTRIGVFSSICVLRVEGQPTTHLDPLVSKLLAQGFRCPIGSAGPHDRSQARRHLHHNTLRHCSVGLMQDQLDVTVRMHGICLATVACLPASRFHVQDKTSNFGPTR